MKPLLLSLLLLSALPSSAQEGGDSTQTAAHKKIENPSGVKGITVYPAKLVFSLDKGGSATQSINIGNFTDIKYQLTPDFRDWTRDTLGRHVYTARGESKQSCADWITFDKTLIELGPNETTTLSVTMKVPDNDSAISEMKWTMLVIKTVNEKRVAPKGTKLAANIEQIYGIGVHILQTPPNITNKELKMVSFSSLNDATNSYRITCKNIGGVELSAKFSIELSEAATGKKITLGPTPIPMFPRQTRYVDFIMPTGLAKGKYTAVAIVDAEDDSVPIEAAEKEIVVR